MLITKNIKQVIVVSVLVTFTSCATSYVAKPLPFKLPSAYPNAQEVGGAVIGARAYTDIKEAKENFGFDIINAGMLPVEIVIDNKGAHPLEINGTQTFLEDRQSNLWPVLNRELAYERATKYAQTRETFSEGAQSGFLGRQRARSSAPPSASSPARTWLKQQARARLWAAQAGP